MFRFERPGAQGLLVAGAGVAMLGLFLLVRSSLIDDAYIGLSYAKNLALHFHWGLIAEETANTATSPLNVLLLGALTAVIRLGGEADAEIALGVLSVAAAMTTAWGLSRVVRALDLPFFTAVLGVGLVLGNPFVLSAVGLEVLLIPAVLIVLVAMAVEGRPGWFGIVAGLTLLCRVDLIVVVLVVAAATPSVRRHWRRALAGAAIAAGPWFVFSWIVLGSALPDTAVIKTAQRGLFGDFGFVTGPVLYFFRHWNAVTAAFLPAVIGLFTLVAWLVVRSAVRWGPSEGPPAIGIPAALGVGGVAYYALLSALRVPPYHWYYVPTLVSLSMFLAIAAGAWLRHARARPQLRVALPAGVLAVAALLMVANIARDLKQGLPWRAPIINSNYAVASDYKRIGLDLRERIGSARVASTGEIGTVAYFCECAIIDTFSDRGATVVLINDRIRQTGAIRSLLYKLNYLWLDRDRQPLPVAHRLRWGPGRGSGPNVWQVWSPWVGPGHVTLVREG